MLSQVFFKAITERPLLLRHITPQSDPRAARLTPKRGRFFQQFSGINAIIYYAPTIFGGLGLNGSTTSLLATGVLGVVDFVFTFPAVFFVDRWGRRKFLMAGALGMLVGHVVVAGIVGHYAGDFSSSSAQAAGWVGVVFIYVSRNLRAPLLAPSGPFEQEQCADEMKDFRRQLLLLLGPSRLAPPLGNLLPRPPLPSRRHHRQLQLHDELCRRTSDP